MVSLSFCDFCVFIIYNANCCTFLLVKNIRLLSNLRFYKINIIAIIDFLKARNQAYRLTIDFGE